MINISTDHDEACSWQKLVEKNWAWAAAVLWWWRVTLEWQSLVTGRWLLCSSPPITAQYHVTCVCQPMRGELVWLTDQSERWILTLASDSSTLHSGETSWTLDLVSTISVMAEWAWLMWSVNIWTLLHIQPTLPYLINMNIEYYPCRYETLTTELNSFRSPKT